MENYSHTIGRWIPTRQSKNTHGNLFVWLYLFFSIWSYQYPVTFKFKKHLKPRSQVLEPQSLALKPNSSKSLTATMLKPVKTSRSSVKKWWNTTFSVFGDFKIYWLFLSGEYIFKNSIHHYLLDWAYLGHKTGKTQGRSDWAQNKCHFWTQHPWKPL